GESPLPRPQESLPMSLSRAWIASCLLASCATLSWAQDKAPATRKPEPSAPQDPFLAKPYLQLGGSQAPGKLLVLWHAADVDAPWAVDGRRGAGGDGTAGKAPKFSRVAVAGVEPHRVYRATIKVEEPGAAFTYRVRNGDAVLFEAEARAPKSADQPHRFVVFG